MRRQEEEEERETNQVYKYNYNYLYINIKRIVRNVNCTLRQENGQHQKRSNSRREVNLVVTKACSMMKCLIPNGHRVCTGHKVNGLTKREDGKSA